MTNKSQPTFTRPCPHWLASLALITAFVALGRAEEPPIAEHPLNTWIKRSPLADGPVSPRLGYEGACVWDGRHGLLVRYGGHNQGGGGEQGAEVWTFDLRTARWTLKEPNTSPPGVCCNAQNLYDPTTGRYLRFPFFSGSHGWQWKRELYLNDSSVWTYDLANNRWRNMRPLPTPRLAPYRCASWDSRERVAVVFAGEGGREGTLIYDPWRNEWRWPKPPQEPAPRSGGNLAYDAARGLHVLFGSQFTDDPHTWTYRVRAVGETGTVSGPSPAALTIPSSPQHVFSREDGTTCQLKWAANPEQRIAGYRVYRLDGRWDKDPVTRLTSEPLTETTHQDPTAGKAARRYY